MWPSRTFVQRARHSFVPKACFPSSESSSRIALRTVKYRLHTLIRVDREARATGAGSKASVVGSSGAGGVMSGSTVERASGRRRVRKSVEAWRYVFVMWDDDDEWRADERDEMELAMMREDEVDMTLSPVLMWFGIASGGVEAVCVDDDAGGGGDGDGSIVDKETESKYKDRSLAVWRLATGHLDTRLANSRRVSSASVWIGRCNAVARQFVAAGLLVVRCMCPLPSPAKTKFFGPATGSPDEPRFGDGAGPGVELSMGGAQNTLGKYLYLLSEGSGGRSTSLTRAGHHHLGISTTTRCTARPPDCAETERMKLAMHMASMPLEHPVATCC